jgi:uncharacterized protein (TIGR02145 family)
MRFINRQGLGLGRTLLFMITAVMAAGVFGGTAVAQGSFTDSRDGQTYKTVVIGGVTWMAENLNYAAGGSWCYNDDSTFCHKYGRLYDWKTAKIVCPKGFSLPSVRDWDDLVKEAGGRTAGKALKSKRGWNDYLGLNEYKERSGGGENTFGFSALPGGVSLYSGGFSYAGTNGYWWTATEDTKTSAGFLEMGYDYDYVKKNVFKTNNTMLSVRCVEE